jgi:hypothetical protein
MYSFKRKLLAVPVVTAKALQSLSCPPSVTVTEMLNLKALLKTES